MTHPSWVSHFFVLMLSFLSRRKFLEASFAVSTAALPLLSSAQVAQPLQLKTALESEGLSFDLSKDTRTLRLHRPSTSEVLSLDYMQEGVWAPGAYSRLCWLMRDVRAQQWVQMDIQLIAILDWTQRYLARFGYHQPISILSGYRNSTTNSRLENASKNSMHLYGKAVDIAIPGLSPRYLSQLMRWLAQGGVGAYESSGFVHIDTGRIRNW